MSRPLLVGLVVVVVVVAGSVVGVASLDDRTDSPDDVTGANDAIEDSERAVTGPSDRTSTAVRRQIRQSRLLQNDCNYTSLYRQAGNAVVAVNSSNESGALSEASGWVYRLSNDTAYVVTNWHVVFGATDYDVQFNRGRWREAELVASDFWTDLAVLRVENPPQSAAALDLANDSVRRGQPIAVLGNADGLAESISRGIVTGVDRSITAGGGPRIPFSLTIPGTIQTDAAAPGGSSGGPWVDCEGEVVAVMHAGTVFQDVSFGIPTDLVRQVVPQLATGTNVTHSFLGVRTTDVGPELAEANNLSVTRGAYVVDVQPGAPADGELRGSPAVHRQTGLPFGGDVILAIDGQQVVDEEDLLSYLLRETRPNETVTLTVLREGTNQTVDVTLGERPQIPAGQRANVTAGANETTVVETTTVAETTVETVNETTAVVAAETTATE